VDLGYPGVLPVLNREAVRMAVKFGLATGSTVARRSVFARKNYFYPDLPKGYQISQYELPIVATGKLDILLDDGSAKTIGSLTLFVICMRHSISLRPSSFATLAVRWIG